MGRLFQAASVVNLVLLVTYEVLYSNQLFDFVKYNVHPSSISFHWSPFVISMPFGVTEKTADGVMYIDGTVTMPNYFFFILVAMVFFNLIVIWKLEKTKTDTNT